MKNDIVFYSHIKHDYLESLKTFDSLVTDGVTQAVGQSILRRGNDYLSIVEGFHTDRLAESVYESGIAKIIEQDEMIGYLFCIRVILGGKLIYAAAVPATLIDDNRFEITSQNWTVSGTAFGIVTMKDGNWVKYEKPTA